MNEEQKISNCKSEFLFDIEKAEQFLQKIKSLNPKSNYCYDDSKLVLYLKAMGPTGGGYLIVFVFKKEK